MRMKVPAFCFIPILSLDQITAGHASDATADSIVRGPKSIVPFLRCLLGRRVISNTRFQDEQKGWFSDPNLQTERIT